MSTSEDKKDARDKLDNLFEVALVLTGVLAAGLFQYVTSLQLSETAFIHDFLWNFSLGFTTFPFVFLILFWIIKEVLIIHGKFLLSLRLTLISWAVWGNLLFIYLTNVFGFMDSSDLFVILSCLLGIVPVALVAYAYKNAAIKEEEIIYFSGNRWKIELTLYISISLVVMIVLFYGFFLALFFV